MLRFDCAHALTAALRTLASDDGVVLLPTETVYGLVCDYEHEAARERIYEMKLRPASKHLAAFFPNAASVERHVGEPLPRAAHRIAYALCPGPLTVIVPQGEGTFGFRIPNHAFLLKLLRIYGRPLANTSANLSGGENALTLDAALSSLASPPDLAVDGGEIPAGSMPSTVVQVFADNSWKILRPGPISAEQIDEVIRTIPSE